MSTEFGKELLLSLPPGQDWAAVQGDVTTLGAWDEEALKDLHVRTCQSADDSTQDTPLMASVREKFADYQSKYTAKDLTATRFTLTPVDDNGSMILHTYLEQVEKTNCRAASWATCWNIQPHEETEAQVSGTAQLHLHYYENANVQLRTTRTFSPQSAETAKEQVNSIVAQMEARTMSYEEKVAKAIIKQITAREKELYQQMQQMQDEIGEKLKKMRRILPITKTRFKWDVAAQKQVKILNERKTA